LGTVFLGTSEFAAVVLERLAREPDLRPLLVITRPDRPSGRGRHLRSPPVADASRRLELVLEQPERVNDPAALALIDAAASAAEQPPTLVVCAFGALIAEPLLSAHEILNVHPSLLPRWRGAAPIERAIMAGDAVTGVSIMRLTAGLDSGPVCLAAPETIADGDTYGTLAERLQTLGGELLVRALRERPACAEQDESAVTYAEKITPEDRLLDPSRPAEELERAVRALTPHIGARVELEGGALGVRRAAVSDRTSVPAGELLALEGRLLLGCASGALELLEVQPPGGRPMDAAAYLRGHAASRR
jgi:methionyl-tRNA formyltransferase